jgi:hypothetical protein
MEFNFSLSRLSLLCALITAFWLLDGFHAPVVRSVEYIDSHRSLEAWRRCVQLFVVGAVSVSLIDHHTGTLDRTSLRFAYVLLGLILMTSGCLWLRSLKQVAKLVTVNVEQVSKPSASHFLSGTP